MWRREERDGSVVGLGRVVPVSTLVLGGLAASTVPLDTCPPAVEASRPQPHSHWNRKMCEIRAVLVPPLPQPPFRRHQEAVLDPKTTHLVTWSIGVSPWLS